MGTACVKIPTPEQFAKEQESAKAIEDHFVQVGYEKVHINSLVTIDGETFSKITNIVDVMLIIDENEEAMKKPERQLADRGAYVKGKTGEYHHHSILKDGMGLIPVVHDRKQWGIDDFFRDGKGNFVFVESKFSGSGDGIADLKRDKPTYPESTEGLKQMTRAWVIDRLSKMQTQPGYTTPTNAEVANEALEAVTAGNFRRIVIHTNTETLNTVLMECGRNDGDWQPLAAFI